MAPRYFHWSSVFDCVMHETDETGATTVIYTHEPSQYGPLLSENRGGTESYHHFDALGSTMMLTDNTGAVTDTFQYDAWGNEVTRTGTTDTPHRWVGCWGYQHETSTGGYYVRARTYQPTVARWMSLDPMPFIDSINRFTAFTGDPIFHKDPTGLLIEWKSKSIATGNWLVRYYGGPALLTDRNVSFRFNTLAATANRFVPANAEQFWISSSHAIMKLTKPDCKWSKESHVVADVQLISDLRKYAKQEKWKAEFLFYPDGQGRNTQASDADVVIWVDAIQVIFGLDDGKQPKLKEFNNKEDPPVEETLRLSSPRNGGAYEYSYSFIDNDKLCDCIKKSFGLKSCCLPKGVHEHLTTPWFVAFDQNASGWEKPI
jgi:RHS repeat-associated protein